MYRPFCPPLHQRLPMRRLYAQCKDDFALIKIGYLRKPLSGGVSSSGVGFKPSRKPLDTAGIL